MVFVVITIWGDKFIPVITKNGYVFIKQKGQRIFFYKEDGSVAELKSIIRSNISNIYIYQTYKIYMGMIDWFDYQSEEYKKTRKYFNTAEKHFSDQELEDFLKTYKAQQK